MPGQNADNAKPMRQFTDLTRKLLTVSKREVDAKRAESKKRKSREVR